MAYIGWFELRAVIRDLGRDLDELDRTLRLGKKVFRPGLGHIRVPLADHERDAKEREHGELTEWLAQLEVERRENAVLAGDLIPEIDRASALGGR